MRGKIICGENKKALTGFEPVISCLLDRRFNQLSHRAPVMSVVLNFNVLHRVIRFRYYYNNYAKVVVVAILLAVDYT